MSNNHDGQITARVGSDVKQELSSVVTSKDSTLSEETRRALEKHIKEHRGERVERANISKLSPWDMGGVAFFVGSIMAGTLTLAGEPMVAYTIAFALTGLSFWAVGQYNDEPVSWARRDRA